MSDRQRILDIITTGYAARQKGDLDGVMQAFCDNAQFRLNSTPAEPMLARSTESKQALRAAMGELIEQFEFSGMEILTCVVEGSTAAVHSKMKVKAKSTGNSMVTELFDLIEIKDGKIASFTQFFDTASAMDLLRAPPHAPVAATA